MDDTLNEQLDYYRARASEYDASTEEFDELKGVFEEVEERLRQLGPHKQVLELASGTGAWTQVLLSIVSEITAIDGAPEMLALAQQKLGDTRVSYQQANLFAWEPEQEYDMVFFASWLSHVRPRDLGAFLTKVARAVRQGGYLAIVDQSAPTTEDREIMKDGEGGRIYAQRPLNDGTTFTIIKVFYDTQDLQEQVAALGFEVVVHQLNPIFFLLLAKRL